MTIKCLVWCVFALIVFVCHCYGVNGEATLKRGLQSYPPSGFCLSQKTPDSCNIYTGCLWVVDKCLLYPTGSPTQETVHPSRSPTSSPIIATKSPTGTPTAKPTTISPTKSTRGPTFKPTTSKPTVKPTWDPAIPVGCVLPAAPRRCENVKRKKPCLSFAGCAFTKKRKCFTRPVCNGFPKDISVPPTAPSCNLPPNGCGKLRKQNQCKNFTGCFWRKKKCKPTGCVESASPSSSPTPLPTMSPTLDPATTQSPTRSPSYAPSFSPSRPRPTTSPTLEPTSSRTRVPTGDRPPPTSFPTAKSLKQFCAVPAGGCGTLGNAGGCDRYDGCSFQSGSCQIRPACSNKQFTCGTNGAAFHLAGSLLPGCLLADAVACDRQRLEVFHGLGLKTECGGANMLPVLEGDATLRRDIREKEDYRELLDFYEYEIFVHPILGKDSEVMKGTREHPVQTIAYALQRTRIWKGARKAIILMGPAVHRPADTIILTPDDSHLIIHGEDGAVVSGAAELDLQWKRTAQGSSIWVADLPEEIASRLEKLAPLFVNDQPAIRARYPNLAFYHDKQYAGKGKLKNWRRRANTPPITDRVNIRVEQGDFGKYYQARGGACDGVFNPPVGYFCEPNHDANGGCPFQMPVGVNLQGALANELKYNKWEHSNIYLHTFHPLRWGLWTFELAALPTSSPSQSPTISITNSPTFKPSKASTTSRPSRAPATYMPTRSPSTPTQKPSAAPTSSAPTKSPSTLEPTGSPTTPTLVPTRHPTFKGGKIGTSKPTRKPTTSKPSKNPTQKPTKKPTLEPTTKPTKSPTNLPTRKPTTAVPSKSPTHGPTTSPITSTPTSGPETSSPSSGPTSGPSASPSSSPSRRPTSKPTKSPSQSPTTKPTSSPSQKVSFSPSVSPTTSPSIKTSSPTTSPSTEPTESESRRQLEASEQVEGSEMFSAAAANMPLYFAKGGFQEARGDCGNGGSEWFVENDYQFLDSTNEFFLDLKDPSGAKLYLIPNKTDLHDPQNKFEIAVLREIFRSNGTTKNPLKDIHIRHVTFEKTYPTHMDDHEMPSGGDWTVHRGGAVILEGVKESSVNDCHFFHLGGNGLFVSRFARDISITRNEFFSLGSSAILLVGDPMFDSPQPWNRTTDENHIERVLIEENVASELGLVVKQSSGAFLAIARSIMIRRNVFFNIARAGIVYNDGFGGNNTISQNVLFNTVMETLDHGPFNVWDRQTWLHSPAVNPQTYPFVVRDNLLLGNSNGAKGIDLDDGARHYDVSNNVIIGGLQKFKGNNIVVQQNLIFPSIHGCVWMTPMNNEPAGMLYRNNTCISGTYPPFYFNLQKGVAESLCRVKNFVSTSNKWIGTNIRNKWNGCGEKKMTWAVWQKKWSQDKDSLIQTKMPSQMEQVEIVKTKLKEIFPDGYWYES